MPYDVIYVAAEWLVIRLRNILYHVCCNNRERLPGKDDDEDDDDDDDDDDAGDTSKADIAATDEDVTEILTKYISQLQPHHMCTDTPYFMGTFLHTAQYNIQYYVIYVDVHGTKKTYDMIFALTMDTAYLVMMMMLMMMMIQVICQYVICQVPDDEVSEICKQQVTL